MFIKNTKSKADKPVTKLCSNNVFVKASKRMKFLPEKERNTKEGKKSTPLKLNEWTIIGRPKQKSGKTLSKNFPDCFVQAHPEGNEVCRFLIV